MPTLLAYEITFSEITPANRNRLGQNFTSRIMWQAPLQTFGEKWRRKKHTYSELLITKTTHRFNQFPAADFREI